MPRRARRPCGGHRSDIGSGVSTPASGGTPSVSRLTPRGGRPLLCALNALRRFLLGRARAPRRNAGPDASDQPAEAGARVRPMRSEATTRWTERQPGSNRPGAHRRTWYAPRTSRRPPRVRRYVHTSEASYRDHRQPRDPTDGHGGRHGVRHHVDLQPVTGEPGTGGEPRTVNVGKVQDLTITGIPCRDCIGTLYKVIAFAPHYRPYGFLQLIKPRKNGASDNVEFWVKPGDVRKIGAPAFGDCRPRLAPSFRQPPWSRSRSKTVNSSD